MSGSGLRFAVKKKDSGVACCSLTVRAGTRFEEGFPEGIAHFVEHTVFKGTDLHRASWISSRLDRLGGELNAYTTKEEIVLYATVLARDLPKALDLILELASRPSFPEKEIEIERGVVIDEIQSAKDSPADEIYDTFESMLFGAHPLGRRILGTVSSVRKTGRRDLAGFVERNFRPEGMALSLVGPFSEGRMEDMALKAVGKYFPSSSPAVPLPSRPADALETALFEKTVSKRNHEVNAIIGSSAPSLYDGGKRMAAILMSNILGGPASNSLLNAELREKHGWVYGVECSYTQYSDTGMMAVSFGCERDNLDKCLEGTGRIISRLQDKPLSDKEIRQAKRQMLGQLAISSEGVEAQSLSIGKSLLAFGKVASDEENKALIEAVSAEDIRKAAEEIFRRPSTLVYI